MCSGVVHWHSQGALESGPACLFLRTWILSSIKGLSFLWLRNCPWGGRLETRKIVWCLVLTIRREGFFKISSGKVPMRRELAPTFLWGTSRNLCSGTLHTTLRTFKTINILDKTFRNPSAFNPSRSAHVHPTTFQKSLRNPLELKRFWSFQRYHVKSSKHLHHCKKLRNLRSFRNLPSCAEPPRGWHSNTSEICLVSPEPLPPPGLPVLPTQTLPELWGLQPGSFSCTASNHPHLWALRSVRDLQFYTRSLLKITRKKSVLWEVCILLHSFSLWSVRGSDQNQDASMTYDPVAPSNADVDFYWSCASGTGSFDCRTLSNFGPQTWVLKILGSICCRECCCGSTCVM